MGQSQAKTTLGQVELSGWYWVNPSRPRLISSRVGPCQWLVKPVQAHVDLSLSGLILSRADPRRYPDDRVRADVESSEPRSMSSWAGPGRCEPSEPKPILSRAGPDQCWVERTRTDVEPSGSGSMLSRANPDRYRVERVRAEIELNKLRPMSSRQPIQNLNPNKFDIVKMDIDFKSNPFIWIDLIEFWLWPTLVKRSTWYNM